MFLFLISTQSSRFPFIQYPIQAVYKFMIYVTILKQSLQYTKVHAIDS